MQRKENQSSKASRGWDPTCEGIYGSWATERLRCGVLISRVWRVRRLYVYSYVCSFEERNGVTEITLTSNSVRVVGDRDQWGRE